MLSDFDPSVPAIRNETIAVPMDPSTMDWYVSISPDNRYLVYPEDGELMIHHARTGEGRQISIRPDISYAYPTFVGTTK